MSDVQRLREELRKRRQAVNNKIARIKRNTGANVSGSEFDPRRPSGVENRYNARQLQAHINELNQFMHRGNKFVADRRGRPIPLGEWNVYKRRETLQAQARNIRDAEMGGISTPTGMSIRQNAEMLHGAQGSSNFGPYQKFQREPGEIESLSALRKLSSSMLNQINANFLPSKLEQGRNNLVKALTIMGDNDAVDRVMSLTDFQFDAFWFGTNVAESVFMKYGIEQAAKEDSPKESWQRKAVDDAVDDIGSVLSWAENLSGERPPV